eukprot:3106741-Alexandrium_andersonii.AAC.1
MHRARAKLRPRTLSGNGRAALSIVALQPRGGAGGGWEGELARGTPRSGAWPQMSFYIGYIALCWVYGRA